MIKFSGDMYAFNLDHHTWRKFPKRVSDSCNPHNSHSHTHTHTHSLTHTLTLTLTHSLTHSHTHTHTHTHSLTHSHTLTYTHTLPHTLTHSLTHSHTHSLTHSHTHTLTHSHTHTHSQGERVPERDFHVATVVRNRVVVFGGRSDTFAPFFTANDIYPNEFFFYELGKMHSPYNAIDANDLVFYGLFS